MPRPMLALLWAAFVCVHSLGMAPPPEECASLATRRASPKALARVHGSSLRTIELAISHCAVQLNWLPRVLDAVQAEHLQLIRVSIYLKCNRSAFSLPDAERAMLPGSELIVDDSLPNVGRCDHAWAHHLWLRWHTLADVVLFLKDTTFSNPSAELARLTLSPRTVISDATHFGFGCFRKPTLGGLAGRLHLRKLLVKFRRSAYRGATKAYKNWLPGKGSLDFRSKGSMMEFVARAFDPWFVDLFKASTFNPVCYGGAFSFLGTSARMHSRQSFVRLRNMLSRADNLEEGHFQERLWMYVLFPEPALTAEESAMLARAANGFAPQPSYVGMVTKAGKCRPKVAIRPVAKHPAAKNASIAPSRK